MGTASHIPVLFCARQGVPSVFDVLRPSAGEDVLDCTLGLGGHAKKFCELVGPEGTVTGLDADAENQALALKSLGGQDHFAMIHANFRLLPLLDLPPFDVIFADLGLSSPHLDDASRGFSFRFDGPLDLRLNRQSGASARDFLSTASSEELFRVFADYGELEGSGRLARAIVETRDSGKGIATTSDLRALVEATFGWKAGDVLAQVFQALRMEVNGELEALSSLLDAIPSHLKPGGRVGIISFHSLEDRLVKKAFKTWCTPEKDELTGQDLTEPSFMALTKKAIVPSDEEVALNPRSRSAKFRAVQRKK